MKIRLLSLVCFLLLSVTAVAQEHLKFKGIPITGSMVSFSQKLKANGFVQLSSENNLRWFSGVFTGQDVKLGVQATSEGANVYAVSVMFDESEEWNVLTGMYQYYKDLYTKKYGSPTNCVENIPSPGGSNSALMLNLDEGRVVYRSYWEVAGGEIYLSIIGIDYRQGRLAIKYVDDQSSEAKMKKEMEEI